MDVALGISGFPVKPEGGNLVSFQRPIIFSRGTWCCKARVAVEQTALSNPVIWLPSLDMAMLSSVGIPCS